jgi:hypothetical protein
MKDQTMYSKIDDNAKNKKHSERNSNQGFQLTVRLKHDARRNWC